MIAWWIIPLIFTVLAAAAIEYVATNDRIDYAGFMALGMGVLFVPALTGLWALCFLLKVFA